MHTEGAAGVSQLDDIAWRKMACSFKESSTILCNSVAMIARRLATEFVDPIGIEPLLANRGIALDKCPGLRPIGVGEILRRIIGKAILAVMSKGLRCFTTLRRTVSRCRSDNTRDARSF